MITLICASIQNTSFIIRAFYQTLITIKAYRFRGEGGRGKMRPERPEKKSELTFHCKTRGKYIIYHCIIRKSRQSNQGALSAYFLPYHPKWWKRRRNYQHSADCWVGILMVIIGFLMVYLCCLSIPLSPLIAAVISKLMVLFQLSRFITLERAPKGDE